MQCSAESVRSKVIAAGLPLPKKHAMTKATFNIFYMSATTINEKTCVWNCLLFKYIFKTRPLASQIDSFSIFSDLKPDEKGEKLTRQKYNWKDSKSC